MRRSPATASTPRSSPAASTRGSRGRSPTCPGSGSCTATPTSLLPVEGEPSIVFPTEARYVGEHGTTWIDDQVFVDRPGEWLADRLAGRRVGVYGLDYVMTVRDFAALRDRAELVPWDVEFDLARAVKSDEELESVRESVRINTEGFWAFLEAYAPGRSGRRGARPGGAALRRVGAAAG